MKIKGQRRHLMSFMFVFFMSLSIFVYHDIFNKLDPKYKEIEQILKKPTVEILYFGSSAIRSCSEIHENNGIDLLLAQKTKRKIHAIYGSWYNPYVFLEYLRKIEKAIHLPKIIVMPIYMKYIQDTQELNPTLLYMVERMRMRMNTGPFEFNDFRKFIMYRFLGQSKKDLKSFSLLDVKYQGNVLGKQIDFLNHPDIPLNFDDVTPYAKLLKPYYVVQYMKPIEESFLSFNLYRQILNICEENNMMLIPYITPINVEDGVFCVGNEFRVSLSRNCSVVNEWFKKRDVHLLDMSTLLESNYFIHDKYVCEHIKFSGKKKVAEKLNDYLEILSLK